MSPGLEGHFFPNPVDPNSHMVMLCYKNGSLSREAVAKRTADGDWGKFAEHLQVGAMAGVRSRREEVHARSWEKLVGRAMNCLHSARPQNTPPGNNGYVGFFVDRPEIIPHIPKTGK